MDDNISEKRRRILQSAGLGGAALLAGCSALDSDSDDNGQADDGNRSNATGDENGQTNNENSQDGSGRSVAFLTGVDQQEARQLQMQLRQEEISQEEFTTQATELIQSSIDSLTEMIESDTSIEIDEEAEVTQRFVGAVRVSGAPGELIDALQSGEVQSIVTVEDFETLAGA